MNGFHEVKRNTQDGFVLAVGEHIRCRSVDGVELREHLKFSAHIVRCLHLAAEGRAPQHQFPAAQLNHVRQVGVPARILLDAERPLHMRKVVAQENSSFSG